MRAALTFLIQWEIKIERKNGSLSDEQLHDIKTPLTQDVKINRKGEKQGDIKQDKPQDNRNTDNQT